MKSAFIDLCVPDWQQILSKAEASEQAEHSMVKLTTTKDVKREHEEDGEAVAGSKPSPKKKLKSSFFCKLHGPDQKHN
jgi:hypothetical protein